MAGKIPLFERTEVGPTRAGTVKPGLNLARGAGISEIGAATAKFAGAIFEDLVATRAANEEATHQGVVRSEMKGFDVFVAANPAASFEELEKERDKMFARIDVAGNKATTRKAQQNIKNFMARNKEFMFKTTQESMEAIRSKQELLASEAHVKNFMNNFQREELREHYEDMLEAEISIYRRDVIFGPVGKDGVRVGGLYEEQVAIIDEAEKKVAVGNAVGIGFDVWQTTVTPEDPDGNLNLAFDAIDALAVPEGDKQEIESELKTRVANRRAETKLEAEQADTKSVETINSWINKGELDGIDKRINQLPLSETRKREEIKKANAHIAAINKGNPSPYEQTDPETYFDLRRKIAIDPLSVTEGDIAAVVGKGLNGGISTPDYERLLGMISPDSPLDRPAAKRAQAAIGRLRNLIGRIEVPDLDEAIEIEQQVLGVSTDLDDFILQNPDATDEEIDKKALNLFRGPAEAITLNIFERFLNTPSQTRVELSNKKFKALEKKRVFKRLSDEDKQKARTAFDLGATLEEVLDNL